MSSLMRALLSLSERVGAAMIVESLASRWNVVFRLERAAAVGSSVEVLAAAVY